MFNHPLLAKILAGLPLGSLLELLLFLIYKNDIPDGIDTLWKIFVKDTFLFLKAFNKSLSNQKGRESLKFVRNKLFNRSMFLT